MIVPQYWAESRLQHREKGHQITLRRFGWSDESQAAAQAHADERVQAAMERALLGEKLPKRDPNVPYNGADGIPIREEIVEKHGETLITRNSYGARCLNTPNALFVDIDFAESPNSKAGENNLFVGIFIFLFVAGTCIWTLPRNYAVAVLGIMLVIWLLTTLATRRLNKQQEEKLSQQKDDDILQNSFEKMQGFCHSHPNWNFRVYRTPAGLRALVTHQPFAASAPEVAQCFKALGADPMYQSMCLKQQCFRARVSAKPWRIGIESHIKIRLASVDGRRRAAGWPVAPEKKQERDIWIAQYEAAASRYAACTFIKNIGSGLENTAIQPVRELHDRLCQALSPLPTA
jgi:hypothetical protein